jgi:hypothetical protein
MLRALPSLRPSSRVHATCPACTASETLSTSVYALAKPQPAEPEATSTPGKFVSRKFSLGPTNSSPSIAPCRAM